MPSVSKYTHNLHSVPEEIGKSAVGMARWAKQVVFFRAWVESRLPYELKSFPKKDHVAAPLLNYMREHGVTIDIPRGMNIIDLKKALAYRERPSAVKDRAFVRKEISEQLWSVHVVIFPWEDVKHM